MLDTFCLRAYYLSRKGRMPVSPNALGVPLPEGLKFDAMYDRRRDFPTGTWAAGKIEGDGSVKIKFSRHARRRGNLYNIPRETVTEILEGKELSEGNHEIVEEVVGFKYPLKIVVSVEGDVITVITNYPLKKGRAR